MKTEAVRILFVDSVARCRSLAHFLLFRPRDLFRENISDTVCEGLPLVLGDLLLGMEIIVEPAHQVVFLSSRHQTTCNTFQTQYLDSGIHPSREFEGRRLSLAVWVSPSLVVAG